ncbi:hypothetical protein BXZ70DRAFT_909344 [Cristinia sonorae]|uniref:Uncharacterized protein n=1 Tax=Cristinia sonorae TaxID=1940300 RepID=A0A8K0XMF7_9AGAR|nr:hypothetical protein BXZ70DRAFT_909344 [Cristinia sonorae]
MAFKFSSFRLPDEHEPLRTDDIFTTTCIIRDELQKMEERCTSAQARGLSLKKKRDELAEVLRLFQLIEENERKETQELRVKLDNVQVRTSNDYQSTIFPEMDMSDATPALHLPSHHGSQLQDTIATAPTLTSVTNHSKGTISATWRSRLSAFMRDSKDDSYVSLPSVDDSDGTASVLKDDDTTPPTRTVKEGSRVLGVVTALKTNVTNSLDKGVKWTRNGSLKSKYSGGSALKKTMPHKFRRQSRKPFVPIVFSKTRLSVKRKNPPTTPKDLEIGLPFDVRKVSGTSTHLGEATMEPLKGAEAFHIGLSGIGLILPSPVSGSEA